MKNTKLRLLKTVASLIAGLLFSSDYCLAEGNPGLIAAPRAVSYSWMSLESWQKKFANQNAVAEQGGVDLLFVGDSITEGWNQTIWKEQFSQYRPANFGIGGDHTGNLLWRLQNGSYGKLQPKAVVLLIGVNNLGFLNATPEQVCAGVHAVLNNLQTLYPQTKILLNGIFPFEESGLSPKRAVVTEINRGLALLGDEKQVFFRNYGALFMQKNGDISSELMRDFLHPTPAAYQLWAEAMAPDIHKLMQ